MKLEDECRLSYYRQIGILNEKHNIAIVQNVETGKIFLRKELKVYDRRVYEHVRLHNSPYFPKIFELVEDEGKLIIIEEYVNGQTLQERIERGPRLSEAEVVKIMIELCEGLSLLHNAHPAIIHRDIKPSNIILSSDFHVKIIDINIAKTYKEGQNSDTYMFGTNGYAAPEQYGFSQSDPRTDIYSMGVLLNVLCTGKLPKEASVQGYYKTIVDKCINIDPDKRYKNIQELAHALNYETRYEPSNINLQTQYKQQKEKRHSRGGYAFIICIIIVSCLVLLFYYNKTKNDKEKREKESTSFYESHDTTDVTVEETTEVTTEETTEVTTEEETERFILQSENDEQKIYLDRGKEIVFEKLSYKTKALTEGMPNINGRFGYISNESNSLFQCYIYLTEEEYDEYVDDFYAAGFDDDFFKGKTYSHGCDSDGDAITLQLQGENIYYLGILNLKR